jgi:hypothetical protein
MKIVSAISKDNITNKNREYCIVPNVEMEFVVLADQRTLFDPVAFWFLVVYFVGGVGQVFEFRDSCLQSRHCTP